MEKTKTKSRLRHPVLLVLAVIATLVSLGFAVVGGNVSRGLTAKPDDLNSLTPAGAYESEIVGGQIFGSLGTYGQQYKLDEKGNIISENDMDYYFLVPVNNDYTITVVTDDEKIISDLTALTAATDKWRNGETDSIEGEAFDHSGMLIALNDDELSHLYAWALQNKLFGAETVEEMSPYIIPYKLCTYNRSGGMPLLIGGCGGFLIFGIACLALVKNKTEADIDDMEEDDAVPETGSDDSGEAETAPEDISEKE